MAGIDLISYLLLFVGLAIVLIAATLAFLYKFSPEARKLFGLLRHAVNPVISPTPGSEWDEIGTFNPAVVEDDEGNIHLVYRAIGNDGVSRFGYAKSRDGRDFSKRSPYPVFAMQNPRSAPKKYEPTMYPSGGSWGGCEDPRTVRIDGRVYMTFNAFDGWDFIRMAVVSIDEKDFFNNKWKWSRPMLISPAKQINKNWVLFPEKINGKFAILHSINPKIQIDFVDRLEDLENGRYIINSHFGSKQPRKTWDTHLRGAGAPPIKTERGWLLLYHATEKNDPHRYKLGAMLLDLENPEVVTAVSPGPILFSEEWYENDWKNGVVYASGAVVRDDNLMVYYGGGDKHVCIAHTPLPDLLDWMVPV